MGRAGRRARQRYAAAEPLADERDGGVAEQLGDGGQHGRGVVLEGVVPRERPGGITEAQGVQHDDLAPPGETLGDGQPTVRIPLALYTAGGGRGDARHP